MAELNEKEFEHLDKKTLITLLAASIESKKEADKTIELLSEQLKRLTEKIDLLTEEIMYLRNQRFGRSTEKHLTDTEDNEYVQLSFAFNEAEVVIDLNPKYPELELEQISPKPYVRGKKNKGNRMEQLKGLKVNKVEYTLTEEQLIKAFPDGKWKRLEDYVYSKLEYTPGTFEVRENHVAVYAGNGENKVVRADRPAELFDNSLASASMVAAIINFKYVNSQPINRMAQEFSRMGVNLPTQNLCRWTIMSSDRYLIRLYDYLKKKLYGYHVIHADETPVKVNRDGRSASASSWMWVYRSGGLEEHPFVLYEYQRTRNGSHPKEFLKGFSGYCVTDGYQVYHSIDRSRDDLKVAGCWAHARRPFADVVKTFKKDDETVRKTVSYKVLQIIQAMCQYEKSFAKLEPTERLEARKKYVAPLVDAFFAYLKSVEPSVTPKSQAGKGISYCLNQEKYLRVFLEDGYIPMENNAAERSIRTFCLGKKNWYVIDTESGAKASAVLYSISETAKANRLKPYEYFKYLLEELPKHGEFEDPSTYMEDLLPWSEKLPLQCRMPD